MSCLVLDNPLGEVGGIAVDDNEMYAGLQGGGIHFAAALHLLMLHQQLACPYGDVHDDPEMVARIVRV